MENAVYLIIGILPLFYNLIYSFRDEQEQTPMTYYQNPPDSDAQLPSCT